MTCDLCLDIQIVCKEIELPMDERFERWIQTALDTENMQQANGDNNKDKTVELGLRIVGFDESRQLNHRYRNRDKPTNVLSFPLELPDDLDLPQLGDLVVCAPLVLQEALEQQKTLDAHWAHMLVHGTLHLLGYDHNENTEAEIMEQLETDILSGLGFPSPYEN